MSLLRIHKILIGAALALAVVMLAWGAQHWLGRGESSAATVFFLGAAALVAGSLYFRKLLRDPPIK